MADNKVLIAPSILSADFSRLGDMIKLIEEGGADWVHIDVMDGHFVPNISIGPVVVKSIRPTTKLFFDVHLMITNPQDYFESFIKAGADLICFHCEAVPDAVTIITEIKRLGCKAGIALKPGTPISVAKPYLDIIDMVLVMSVEPGFSGQSFIPESIDKIRQLKTVIDTRACKTIIQVDGGIGADNVADVVSSGAQCIVGGNAIFGDNDPKAAIKRIRDNITN